MEINNEFQNLKKRKMSVSEYPTTFTEKMKLVPNLVPTKPSKVDKFDMRPPADCSPTLK